MAPSRRRRADIRALISDVDGTLVTDEKVLTASTQAAAAELHARGIAFSIISSRPPRGLRMLLDPLGITAPIGCFNGAILATPDLSVISEHLLAPEVARRAVDLLEAKRVQVWVFSGPDWLVRDPCAPYVEHEERTLDFGSTLVKNFAHVLDAIAKIVGVSPNFELLARCERDLRAELGGRATAVRSQPYYLDVTSPLANKGVAFCNLARLLGVAPVNAAVIGDGSNDLAMFARSGLSIAMGNASPEVQQAADFVTDSNHEDGFASAVYRFILDRDGLTPWAEVASTRGRA
jgi:Cof subfamily protein (haloacid dehalogenase superfamily)